MIFIYAYILHTNTHTQTSSHYKWKAFFSNHPSVILTWKCVLLPEVWVTRFGFNIFVRYFSSGPVQGGFSDDVCHLILFSQQLQRQTVPLHSRWGKLDCSPTPVYIRDWSTQDNIGTRVFLVILSPPKWWHLSAPHTCPQLSSYNKPRSKVENTSPKHNF